MLLSPLPPVPVAGGGGAPTRALSVRGTETRHTPPHRPLPTTATKHSPCFWNRNKPAPNVCSNAAVAVSGVRHGTIAGGVRDAKRTAVTRQLPAATGAPSQHSQPPQQLEQELARATMAILIVLEHRSRRSGTCAWCRERANARARAGAHRSVEAPVLALSQGSRPACAGSVCECTPCSPNYGIPYYRSRPAHAVSVRLRAVEWLSARRTRSIMEYTWCYLPLGGY
jgi:hypothetical protein